MSNCTIWVEGPTDIYYINSYLDLYSCIHKKRTFLVGYNYNYAFNGSINIASKFDFSNSNTPSVKINKISQSNYLIFDSDNLNEDHANFKKIEKIIEKLPNRCCVIRTLKTIENIIPPTILKEYFKIYYKPKDREIKKIVLEYFDSLCDIYPYSGYYSIDHIDKLSKFVYANASKNNKIKEKKTLMEYKKYFQGIWKSNKYDLAVFFAEKIKNLDSNEKEKIYRRTLDEFIHMIENIYKFIAENNK